MTEKRKKEKSIERYRIIREKQEENFKTGTKNKKKQLISTRVIISRRLVYFQECYHKIRKT